MLNRKSLMSGAAALALFAGTSLPATAADMPIKAPTSAINWAGDYVGVHMGLGGAKVVDPTSSANLKTKGAVIGLHYGRNWQTGNVVYGWEADISYSTVGQVLSHHAGIDLMASLRGRYGMIHNRVFWYGTGGVGYIRAFAVSSYGAAGPGYKNIFRPVVGFGAEMPFSNNFTLRAETLAYIGSNVLKGVSEGLHMKNTFVTRIGLSYKY